MTTTTAIANRRPVPGTPATSPAARGTCRRGTGGVPAGQRSRTARREHAGRRAGRAGAAGRAATRHSPQRARRRRVALALLAVVTIALLTGGAAAGTEAGGDPATALRPGPDAARAGGRVLVLSEGETLWDVVLPHTPEGVDPAVFVARVVAANGLDPRSVPPGTLVRLP